MSFLDANGRQRNTAWMAARSSKKAKPSSPSRGITRNGEEGLAKGPPDSDATRSVLDNGRGLGSLSVLLAVDCVEDFLPVDGDFFGGDDSQPDFVAADLHHRDGDVVVDHDTLIFFPRQY